MWLAGWAVVIAELIVLLGLGWLYSRHSIVISVEKGADVATLVLTAATLVITGVAVMVGIVAVWGFKEIRDRAIEAAVAAALEAVSEDRRRAFEQGQASPELEEANRIADVMNDGEPHGN